MGEMDGLLKREKPEKKRWALKIFIGLTVFMVLFHTALYFICGQGGDTSWKKYPDLTIKKPDLPEGQNGYIFIEMATKIADCEDYKNHKKLRPLYSTQDWNPSKIADLQKRVKKANLFERNKEALLLLEKGLGKSRVWFPHQLKFDSPIPNLVNCRVLADLFILKAIALQEKGKDKEAFDEVLKVFQFGYKLQKTPILINGMIGIAIQSQGGKALRHLLKKRALKSADLLGFLKKLQKYDQGTEALADCYKGEFHIMNRALPEIRSGALSRGNFSIPYRSHKLFPLLAQKYAGIFLFQPNHTRDIFGKSYQIYLKTLSKNYQEGRKYIDSQMKHYPLRYLKERKKWHLPNLLGVILYKIGMPDIIVSIRSIHEGQTRLRGTLVLVALKAYKLDKGHLPGGIKDLVPGYLPSIPKDSLDGTPFEFSLKDKQVYSSGWKVILKKDHFDAKYQKIMKDRFHFKVDF